MSCTRGWKREFAARNRNARCIERLVADQNRVFDEETPTEGYTTARFFTSYSFSKGGVLNTITARLDNATDTLYRNHLNYLKDVLPEMGRSMKLVYSIAF